MTFLSNEQWRDIRKLRAKKNRAGQLELVRRRVVRKEAFDRYTRAIDADPSFISLAAASYRLMRELGHGRFTALLGVYGAVRVKIVEIVPMVGNYGDN